MFKKALIASSILLLSATVNAEGGYLGLSAGKTDMDLKDFDDGGSFAATLGYKVNKNFAVEASYIDLGESENDEDYLLHDLTVDGHGFNLSLVGILPIHEKIDIFAKVGAFMWDISLNEAGTGELVTENSTDLSLGLGISANLTDQCSVVFEYQEFQIEDEVFDGDISNISIGARFNF